MTTEATMTREQTYDRAKRLRWWSGIWLGFCAANTIGGALFGWWLLAIVSLVCAIVAYYCRAINLQIELEHEPREA